MGNYARLGDGKRQHGIAKLLFNNRAGVGGRSCYGSTTYLHITTENGRAMVVLLLENDINTNVRNCFRNTALRVTVIKDCISTVRILLDIGTAGGCGSPSNLVLKQ